MQSSSELQAAKLSALVCLELVMERERVCKHCNRRQHTLTHMPGSQ